MPGEIDLPIPDPGGLTRGRFTYFPVVPGRLEFAIEVRAAILRDRPEVIALELPATLQPAWIRPRRCPISPPGPDRRWSHQGYPSPPNRDLSDLGAISVEFPDLDDLDARQFRVPRILANVAAS